MKLSNGEIFSAREPLQKLMEQKFPVVTSYKLAKLANKLNDQFKVIEEVRVGLVKKYGEADKGKLGQTKIAEDSENFTKFIAEFNELMVQEVDVEVVKVKLPERVAATCDACHHNMDKMLEIEPSTLMALEKFVEV